MEGGEDKGDNGKNDLSLVHQAKKTHRDQPQCVEEKNIKGCQGK